MGTATVTGKVECLCCGSQGSRAGAGFNGISVAQRSSCYLAQPDCQGLENHPQPMKGRTRGTVTSPCLVMREAEPAEPKLVTSRQTVTEANRDSGNLPFLSPPSNQSLPCHTHNHMHSLKTKKGKKKRYYNW